MERVRSHIYLKKEISAMTDTAQGNRRQYSKEFKFDSVEVMIRGSGI